MRNAELYTQDGWDWPNACGPEQPMRRAANQAEAEAWAACHLMGVSPMPWWPMYHGPVDQPELYVPARERPARPRGLGIARLSFVCGALLVAFCLWMALSHLGERIARDYFDAALFAGFGWWAAHRVIAWIARGFAR